MKLIINTTILNNLHLTGLGVYTHNLVENLIPLLSETGRFDEMVLIGSEERCRQLLGGVINDYGLALADAPAEAPIKRLWEIDRAVTQHAGGGRSLLYSTTHHGITRGKPRQVITVHDLFARLFPDNYPSQSKYFKYVLPWVLRKTDQVIVVSESTATDFRTYYGQKPSTVVIHEGLRRDLLEATPEPLLSIEKQPFFLFVGPTYAYKNADRVIAAFAAFRERTDCKHLLVLTGGRRDYIDWLKQQAQTRFPELVDDIRFVGYVDTAQLAWLYTRATALLITTLYEGFGLPALEAMHAACPVIASDVSSLPEVCGDAALFVDPQNADSIADAMEQMAGDDTLQQHLITRGKKNAERFSWRQAAEKVCEVLLAVASRDTKK